MDGVMQRQLNVGEDVEPIREEPERQVLGRRYGTREERFRDALLGNGCEKGSGERNAIIVPGPPLNPFHIRP